MSCDIPSQSCSVLEYLLHAAEQHTEHGLLDVVMAVDGGSQGMGQHLKRVVLFAAREPLYLCHVTGGEERSDFFGEGDDVGGKEHRAKCTRGVARALGWKTSIVADDLNPVTRLKCENA